MNDTHPALAGPELIRLLTDAHGLGFDEAFDIAQACLGYTNHTLLPEALERWSTWLVGQHPAAPHADHRDASTPTTSPPIRSVRITSAS